MKDVLVLSIPSVILWVIVLLIYVSKRSLEKKATEITIGIIKKNTLGKVVGSENTHYYRKLLIEYQINGKDFKKVMTITQFRYFHKIPIGQQSGLPVGTKVELLYNPKNIYQIYSKIDDQFDKKVCIIIFSVIATPYTLFPILFLLKEIGITFF